MPTVERASSKNLAENSVRSSEGRCQYKYHSLQDQDYRMLRKTSTRLYEPTPVHNCARLNCIVISKRKLAGVLVIEVSGEQGVGRHNRGLDLNCL